MIIIKICRIIIITLMKQFKLGKTIGMIKYLYSDWLDSISFSYMKLGIRCYAILVLIVKTNSYSETSIFISFYVSADLHYVWSLNKLFSKLLLLNLAKTFQSWIILKMSLFVLWNVHQSGLSKDGVAFFPLTRYFKC